MTLQCSSVAFFEFRFIYKSSKALSNFSKLVGWLDGDSASSIWGVGISVCSSAQIGPRRGFKVSSAPRHCACERSFSCRKKFRVGPNYSDRLWCCPIDVLKFSVIFLKSSAARRDLRSVSVWGLLQARDVLFLLGFAALRKCLSERALQNWLQHEALRL